MTHSVGVSLRTPGWAPWGLVLSTPLILFAWVSRVLLSVWFEWYLVFASGGMVCVNSAGVGMGRGGTLAPDGSSIS